MNDLYTAAMKTNRQVAMQQTMTSGEVYFVDLILGTRRKEGQTIFHVVGVLRQHGLLLPENSISVVAD